MVRERTRTIPILVNQTNLAWPYITPFALNTVWNAYDHDVAHAMAWELSMPNTTHVMFTPLTDIGILNDDEAVFEVVDFAIAYVLYKDNNTIQITCRDWRKYQTCFKAMCVLAKYNEIEYANMTSKALSMYMDESF